MEATENQSEPQTVEPAASDQASKKRSRRSRWGAETEAGLKVLADESNGNPAKTEETPGEPQVKKRRSRWGPEEAKPALVPGTAIVLPASLAHLVDTCPEALALQRQLASVSDDGAHAGTMRPSNMHASKAVTADRMAHCQPLALS